MQVYSVGEANPHEQRELTRLCVRATMQAGYDEAFIDRAMPVLTVTLPLITGGCVQVAQQESGEVCWRRGRDAHLTSRDRAALRHVC